MSIVNVQVSWGTDTYEVELDDEVDPKELARTFARDIQVAKTGADYRFVILGGQGIAEGGILELLEVPPPSSVRVKSKRSSGDQK